MTKMFWSLVKIRLSLLFTSGKRTNSNVSTAPRRTLGKGPKIILISVLAVYCIAVYLGMFGALFYSLGTVFGGTELEWFYFSLAGIMSFVLSFIGSVFAAQTQIYDAKDNELLLSMPIPVRFILASRMVALLAMNLGGEALVMLPAVVVWGILGHFTLGSIVGVVALFIAIPFLSMSLSCAFGGLIAWLTSKVKRKNLIITALYMLSLVAYLAVYTLSFDYIETLISNGEQIAIAIKNGFYPAYALGLAGSGNYFMIFAVIAVTVVLFAAIYFVLDRSFIKLSTSGFGTAKFKYKGGKMKESKITVALIKKEFTHFITNPMYIMNASLGVVFSLIAAGAVAVNGVTLFESFDAAGFPIEFLDILIIAISLSLVSFNVISAPSISLEAKTLWLLRALPVDPSKILLAKAWNHFLISEVGVLTVGISAMIFLPLSVTVKLLVLIVPTIFNAFCALYGVFINLLLPKFNWINETAAIKQGISTLVCMFSCMGVAAVYLLPYILWLEPYVSVYAYTLIFVVLVALAAVVIYKYLTNKGKDRFEQLI